MLVPVLGDFVNIPAGGSLLSGDTIFVDSINGNDSTGLRGNANKPFLTLLAAKAAASSGDLICVRPGSYSVTDTILKNGVNWYFSAGCSVSKTQVSGDVGLLDDGGVATSCVVYGEGDFLHNNNTSSNTGCVKTTNASSIVTIHAHTIAAHQTSGGSAIPVAVFQDAGELHVKASLSISAIDDNSSGTAVCLYWQDGYGTVEAPSIFSTQVVVWSQSDGSSALNFHVKASEIYSTGTASGIGLPGVIIGFTAGGSSANAAIWVEADTIRANAGTLFVSVYSYTSSLNKIYVKAQKLYGSVQSDGDALMYVTATKSEAISNVSGSVTALFAAAAAGTLRYNVLQHDPKAFTGIAFKVTGGTFISNEIEYTSGSGSDGFSISSGTARIQTAVLDVSGNSSGNPINKTGGILKLMACTLVANSGRDSIAAATSQNVVAMSSWANKAVNGNVTITTTGGLTVDTDVV